MSNINRVWGIMRVVDGELCFLDSTEAFAPLSDNSAFYASRNDAFTVAQRYRGLLCCITPDLARAYALSSPHWPHNAERGGQPVIELVRSVTA